MHLRKKRRLQQSGPMQPGEEETWGKRLREPGRNRVSLEPLRADAPAALDARGIRGLPRIWLSHLQVQYSEIPPRTLALTVPDIRRP
jgi:hypothetical protein